MSQRPSSAAICAWKVTCSSRSPSSSRIPASSSASIASSSSCVSSRRWRASVRWVCSWSQGHPSGARRRACTRIRSSRRCAALRRRHRPVRGRLAHGEAGTPLTASTDGEERGAGVGAGDADHLELFLVEPTEARIHRDLPVGVLRAHPGAELVHLGALQDLVARLRVRRDLLVDLPDDVPAVLRLHRLRDLTVVEGERGVGELGHELAGGQRQLAAVLRRVGVGRLLLRERLEVGEREPGRGHLVVDRLGLRLRSRPGCDRRAAWCSRRSAADSASAAPAPPAGRR